MEYDLSHGKRLKEKKLSLFFLNKSIVQ